MPKLYTKTGDKGTTSLYDGNRIPKNSIFFDVLGDLDELSSHIGMLITLIKDYDINYLRFIQKHLLNIGSNIAVVNNEKKVPIITENNIRNLELEIDDCESCNKKITEFLLPGVNKSDAQCHICRSVTRRLERNLWKLHYSSDLVKGKRNNIELSEVHVDDNILVFINRLSDYFFALSRNLSEGNDVKVSDIKINIKK